jgi:hypothetical protein
MENFIKINGKFYFKKKNFWNYFKRKKNQENINFKIFLK